MLLRCQVFVERIGNWEILRNYYAAFREAKLDTQIKDAIQSPMAACRSIDLGFLPN